ncbi:MAG: N-acyl-D-amino-acid deacylase family protein [Caulobacteraceae bacterium]
MFELVINNGNVVNIEDGTISKCNIGIKSGKIAALSRETIEGEISIDASGMLVSPGFIDMHMHEDPLNKSGSSVFIEEGIFKNMVLMGVTTCIGGNCGIAMDDVGGYLQTVDQQGISVNFGTFLGYSAVREKIGVLDNYRPLTKIEAEEAKKLIRAGLSEGAVGLSFGLEYTPGSTTNELIEMAKVLRDFPGKMLAAHYRYDASEGIEAVKELIGISWAADVPMQISHIGSCTAFGMMEESLQLIEKARSIGIDVMADCYPYDAFCTHIGTAVFDGDCFSRWNKDYSAVVPTEGKYKGKRCTREMFEYLRENEPNTLVVTFVMDENEVTKAITHPLVIIASDGLMHNGQGHPRGAGAFPRVIAYYTREKKVLSLMEALRKMTLKPAQRLGLREKGILGIGKDADIVIFDSETVMDKADFEQPSLPPEGIPYVIVNGKVVVKEGSLTGEKPGKAIRFGGIV